MEVDPTIHLCDYCKKNTVNDEDDLFITTGTGYDRCIHGFEKLTPFQQLQYRSVVKFVCISTNSDVECIQLGSEEKIQRIYNVLTKVKGYHQDDIMIIERWLLFGEEHEKLDELLMDV